MTTTDATDARTAGEQLALDMIAAQLAVPHAGELDREAAAQWLLETPQWHVYERAVDALVDADRQTRVQAVSALGHYVALALQQQGLADVSDVMAAWQRVLDRRADIVARWDAAG